MIDCRTCEYCVTQNVLGKELGNCEKYHRLSLFTRYEIVKCDDYRKKDAMLEITNEKCPYCGSKVKACMSVTSITDSANLIVYPTGCINYIHACIDCGGIYLPEQYRQEIRNKLGWK